jgi:hypothetical protein
MTSLSETSLLAGAAGQSTGYTIGQSILFNDDDSAYMAKTFSSAGNRRTFTISTWVKRGNLSTNQMIFGPYTSSSGSGTYGAFRFPNGNTFDIFDYTNGTNNYYYSSSPTLFRDTNAWYHIVANVDTTRVTASERIRVFINGVRDVGWSGNDDYYPSLNYEGQFNNALVHEIGRTQANTQKLDAYLAEFHFLDGYAYDSSYFGEFDSNDIWIPKEYTGSYGSNGFKIDGRDSSDLGDDESGNGNDFSTSGLTAADQVLDSPTNNHGVFNNLEKDLRYTTTLSNGNKTITFPSGSSGYSGTRLGFFRNTGKAYAEFKVGQTYSHTNGDGIAVFVCDDSNDPVSVGGGGSGYTGSYTALDGIIYDGGSNQGTGTTWNSVGAVIGVYVDFDSGKGWFSKDGTVQTVNGTPNVNNGTNPHFTFTANETLTVGAGGVHYGTVGIVTLQNHEDEWDTTPTGYTPFSTLAESEA